MAPRYVAHRGGAALWPENSLEAFRGAIALGARMLELAAPTAVVLLIEIKTPGPAVTYCERAGAVQAVPGERYPGLEQRVLASLAAAGLAERANVMAFNPAVLAEVRSLAPRQPTTLLVDRHHVAGADARGADAVAWATGVGVVYLGLHVSLCDEAVITAARAAGVAVGVFTVNDETEMRRLAALGVDVIISDRADLVAKMEREAAAKP